LGARLLALVAVALLSHLVLDSWNSYGVHPFWPVDSRWYYGDAIYIFEPWLWVVLGVSATMNTGNARGRTALGATLAVLAAALAWRGMIPLTALAALGVMAVVLVGISRRWNPRRRAGTALAVTAAFVVAMFGVRERARAMVHAAIAQGSRANVVDVILSPEPANPLCWSALTVVRDDATTEYVMTRGTVTAVLSSGCGAGRQARVMWDAPVHQSVSRLQALVRSVCAVRAWMQFGRAPEVAEDAIGDLRYGGATRDNFSKMPLRTGANPDACPPHLTHWGVPRADLLEGHVSPQRVDGGTLR
jgi:inner membrane protein